VAERVCVDVSDLGPGELRAFEHGSRRVLVCNTGEAYYAIENRCPHAGVPLARGRLRGCLLECPFHGGVLDVRDGSPQALPIRRPAVTFAVRPVPDGLEIELGA
jgi:3-phenylpropionate/trans-cinnamate dioxygenase ferredoxin component